MTSVNTSTPKRRRLGTRRILRPRPNFGKDTDIFNSPSLRSSSPLNINDDLPLPSNQIEYLCDSGNTHSASCNISCNPGILSSSIVNNMENWESLAVRENYSNPYDVSSTICKDLNEIEYISDEMFNSKLEQESTQPNPVDTALLISRCEKYFKENVEESFTAINQSICGVQNEGVEEKWEESFMFKTKDSFLLDIKESGLVLENQKYQNDKPKVLSEPRTCDKITKNNNSFYGLPMIAKGLFKSYRNIEKFYDWQEECLNLDAIKERRNLIYALPTSGGKTLVAEVLILRELLNRKKSALFILPFVAIVQEKMWALSPFALALDFLAEEYAAGRGALPPARRRAKRSVYVATIEKALALLRSLVETDRLDELGLIVVDELHLIGEPGRGATLETLLATVLFTNKEIQVVGMSATIGNLAQLAGWLRAEVFTRDFRPVQLAEFVKLGDTLHRLRWGARGQPDLVPDRQLTYDYSGRGAALDPERLGGLVAEAVPAGACLVFCPTQRNAESVAKLLCQMQRREMIQHRSAEREALEKALRSEEASGDLARCVRFGVAYHHAGLASDERSLLEQAYRAGVISVLCCTSTLAAGVNLPASRVLVRAPRVGRAPLSLAAYRQMAGRAGRAGLAQAGECITICSEGEWAVLRETLAAGLAPARSVLAGTPDAPDYSAVHSLVLSGLALRLTATRAHTRRLLACTLLAHAHRTETHIESSAQAHTRALCDAALHALLQSGAVRPARRPEGAGEDDCELAVSPLGLAAVKGCMDVAETVQLVADLDAAARALVTVDALHLLYLVAPPPPPAYRIDGSHYYSLYCNLDDEGRLTAAALGVTEAHAIRMMTGKPLSSVLERVTSRFYVALMLRDLWRQLPFPLVAAKYSMPRGAVQALLRAACTRASGAGAACEQLPRMWPFRALLLELGARLRTAAAPHLADLMELPQVHKPRAAQLAAAGYRRVQDVARAQPDALARAVPHLSRRAAGQLVSAARMMLIEKVENLRAEAENVMEELQV